MAWVETNEDLDQAESVASRGGNRDVRVFVVTFDAPATPYQARTAPRVPRGGDPHNETGNYASQIRPQKRDSTRTVYDVLVTYQPIEIGPPPRDEEQGGGTSPENRQAKDPRIPRLEINDVQRSKTFRRDIHGRPLTNSAGTPRTYPGDDSYTELLLRGRIPFDLFDKSMNKTYGHTVNSKALFGYKKHTMRLLAVRGQTVLEDSKVKWDVEVRWHIRDTWKAEYLDEGFAEATVNGFSRDVPYDGASQADLEVTKRKKIIDEHGLAPSEAQLLDGTGSVLEQGSSPVYVTRPIYKPADHATMLKAMRFSTNWSDYGDVEVIA